MPRVHTLLVIHQGERGEPGKRGVPGLIVSIEANLCSKQLLLSCVWKLSEASIVFHYFSLTRVKLEIQEEKESRVYL